MREPTTSPLIAWSRTFPATAAQVGEARQFLSAILDGAADADDAVLCVSELATNATLHSRSREPGGKFTLRVERGEDRLRVEVRDDGGAWTWPPPDSAGVHGRGLLIISELASAWGRAGDAVTGWTVWFELECPSLPRRSASARPAGPRRRQG